MRGKLILSKDLNFTHDQKLRLRMNKFSRLWDVYDIKKIMQQFIVYEALSMFLLRLLLNIYKNLVYLYL